MRWQSLLNASWLWVFPKDQEISRFFLVLRVSIVSFFQALFFPFFLLFSNWNCEASNAGKNDVWMQIYVPAAVIETGDSKHKNPTNPRQGKKKKNKVLYHVFLLKQMGLISLRTFLWNRIQEAVDFSCISMVLTTKCWMRNLPMWTTVEKAQPFIYISYNGFFLRILLLYDIDKIC